MKPLAPLAVYTFLWGFSTQLEAIKGPLGGPLGPWVISLLLLCLAAAMRPQNTPLVTMAYSMRIVWWLTRWPMMWASEIIGGLTDLAVVLHLVVQDGDDSSVLTEYLSTSMRRQTAWFYFFAGFWKLNTSFLDHRYSCASVFFAQLLDAYVPPHLLTATLAELAIRAAPAVTVAIEVGVGVLMLLGEWSARCRAAGVALALALHVGIDITPMPHNIANFSHKIGLRCLWFLPYGASAAAQEVLRRPLLVGAAYVALAAAALVATQQPHVWARWTAAPWDSVRTLDVRAVDWHVSAHAALTILLLRGLTIGESDGSTTVGGARGPPPPPRSRRVLVHFNALLCVLWAGGTVVLGTSDNSTPNMYSNLRQQGGSNHLLPIPFSLLPRSRYHGHGVSSDPFSGGLVRIERHNSSRMSGYCPAETTPHLSAGSIALLKRFGHSGRVFNPAFALNIGPHAMPPRPDGPFVRYTLPAYELRRQLRDAIAAAESFELVYSSLPGATGDEQWRVHASGRTVKLLVARGARVACTVLAAGSSDAASTCQPDDLALAPFPSRDYWARPLDAFFGGLQSWNPQPILWEDQTEIHCYG